MNYAEESLKLHYQWKGKLDTVPKMKVENSDDLSLAYTPGVAQPCLEIQKNPSLSYELTGRGQHRCWSSPTAPPFWAWATLAPRPACP